MTVKLQQSFPYSPHHTTWEDFNGNLIVYYSQEQVPYNMEENWQETAFALTQNPKLNQYLLPNPDTFGTWQDWAHEFILHVSGKN